MQVACPDEWFSGSQSFQTKGARSIRLLEPDSITFVPIEKIQRSEGREDRGIVREAEAKERCDGDGERVGRRT